MMNVNTMYIKESETITLARPKQENETNKIKGSKKRKHWIKELTYKPGLLVK